MSYACKKELLDNFVGKEVAVYHANDMDVDGDYSEFRSVMQGYRVDPQFGLVDVHLQGHKDIEINLFDDVDVSDTEIVGGDVCGLFFSIKAA